MFWYQSGSHGRLLGNGPVLSRVACRRCTKRPEVAADCSCCGVKQVHLPDGSGQPRGELVDRSMV